MPFGQWLIVPLCTQCIAEQTLSTSSPMYNAMGVRTQDAETSEQDIM